MKGLMKTSSLALIIFAGLSQSSFADPTQININGTVVASACTVDNAGAPVQVTLDTLEATALATAGESGGWKTFDLKLINCPATTTVSTATFAGTPATANANLYTNTGTATNVEVELQNTAGKQLGNGATYAVDVDASTHEVVYPLQARAFTTAGSVMPGTIIGSVQATFTYQ
ncbi:type 1 fimbrial protein [Rouxiella chamberiensis]|nr:type 1 fimbrial protein [Rouxiella chamberiensis]